MAFSSFYFLFLFLPIFFGIYYYVPARGRNWVLLIGSLAFYIIGSYDAPEHLILLLLSILLDFYLGCAMERFPRRKKILLWSGLTIHLGALAFFKYFNFAASELHRLTEMPLLPEILLPMGISFYTFQGISYLVDVYRGKIRAERSLLRFSVFISMFEQLIAGPIVTYDQVQKSLSRRRITSKHRSSGLGTFLFGLGLKVLLANPLGKLFAQVQNIGFESISTPLAWMAITAFSLQLYLDFYGYSIMAQGLGRMMGFRIPRNFYFPYLSCSMTEFWRRWHITLGSWFREYVYIPLGGNRKGVGRTVCNLLAVWMLTGLWHGAGYNFLLWGLSLGLILMGEKFLYGAFLQAHRLAGHLYMLVLIPVTWSIFAIEQLPQLGMFLRKLFFLGPAPLSSGDFLKYAKLYWPFLLAGILFSTPIPYQLLRCIRSKYIQWGFLLLVFGGCVYLLYMGLNDPFLYFRF